MTDEQTISMSQAELSALIAKEVNKGLTARLDREFEARQPKKEESTVNPALPPEVQDLLKQFDVMKKQNAELKADSEKRLKREQEVNLNETLRKEFLANNFDPRHVDHAVAYHKGVGNAYVDVDGTPRLKIAGQDLSVADGARAYARLDDAKLYLAPKGTGGSQTITPPVKPTVAQLATGRNLNAEEGTLSAETPDLDAAILAALGRR